MNWVDELLKLNEEVEEEENRNSSKKDGRSDGDRKFKEIN